MKYYHITAKKNRGSIRRYGLLARDTNKHNYPGITEQPVGVFVSCGDGLIFNHCPWDLHIVRDMWEIDAGGLPVSHDRILPEFMKVILCTIPPERLTLAATFNEEDLRHYVNEVNEECDDWHHPTSVLIRKWFGV